MTMSHSDLFSKAVELFSLTEVRADNFSDMVFMLRNARTLPELQDVWKIFNRESSFKKLKHIEFTSIITLKENLKRKLLHEDNSN